MAKQYCVMKEVSIQLVELMDLHITVIFIGKLYCNIIFTVVN